MVCPHCGENNPDKAKYCVRCSATLPRKQGAGGARSGGIDAKTVIIIVLVVALVIGAIFFVRSLVKDYGIFHLCIHLRIPSPHQPVQVLPLIPGASMPVFCKAGPQRKQ